MSQGVAIALGVFGAMVVVAVLIAVISAVATVTSYEKPEERE